MIDYADWAPEPDEYAFFEQELRFPPELFALCELERDSAGHLVDGQLFAWGLAFDDRVEMVSINGHGGGTFHSVDSALNLFSHTSEIRLTWPSVVHSPTPVS